MTAKKQPEKINTNEVTFTLIGTMDMDGDTVEACKDITEQLRGFATIIRADLTNVGTINLK